MTPTDGHDGPKRIFLLDGHSLAYRAFFALPATLATSTGQITNAVYGFTSMLIKLLGDEHPDYLAVAQKVNQIEIYKQAAALSKSAVPKDAMRTSKLSCSESPGWSGFSNA